MCSEDAEQMGAPWFVYLARCSDGSTYCGITPNVEARLAAHNSGRGARYTRGRGPVVLLGLRRYGDRGHALRVEAAIKKLPRAQKLAIAADPRGWAAVARGARRSSG